MKYLIVDYLIVYAFGQKFLLTENQCIIKAHYGYTNIDVSKQTTYDYMHNMRTIEGQ